MSKCRFTSKQWPCFLKDQHCQKNTKWACIHELKCLLIFKKIYKKEVESVSWRKILNVLCEELSKDKDFFNIGNEEKVRIKESRISSIKQKIYNIHSLSGEKIEGLYSRSNASKTTKEIFKKCKDWTSEMTGKEIEDLKLK